MLDNDSKFIKSMLADRALQLENIIKNATTSNSVDILYHENVDYFMVQGDKNYGIPDIKIELGYVISLMRRYSKEEFIVKLPSDQPVVFKSLTR